MAPGIANMMKRIKDPLMVAPEAQNDYGQYYSESCF